MASKKARSYRVISADSHLEPAVERWTPRIPAKYQDQAPRRIRLPDGGDATIVEGQHKPHVFLGGLVGRPYEKRSPSGGVFATAPGAGTPERRLEEQDMDGVDAEILYHGASSMGSYSGIKDKNAYRAVVHAWNEFLAEEYCTVAPDRLIALGMLPDTGAEDDIAEMEYCARVGLKGVCLTRYPSGKDVPTPEDDRFWAASLDMDMPLTVHVAFGGVGAKPAPNPQEPDPALLEKHTAGIDPFSKLTKYGFRGAGNAVQMVFSGVFDRFPRLRIYFAETQVGWIPNFYDQLDDQYDRIISWSERLLGMRRLDRRPSDYIRDHVWWGFMRNPYGVRARHDIGLTHMMWSSDFPHAETDWPQSQQVIDEMFAEVPADERYQILAGNVIEYFHLSAAAPADRDAGGRTGADGDADAREVRIRD